MCKRCEATLTPLRDLVILGERHSERSLTALYKGDAKTALAAAEKALRVNPTPHNHRLRTLATCLRHAEIQEQTQADASR